MNVLCKPVHLLDSNADNKPDCNPDNFALCKGGIVFKQSFKQWKTEHFIQCAPYSLVLSPAPQATWRCLAIAERPPYCSAH